MATVTSYTREGILALLNDMITGARIVGDNLVLSTKAGGDINVGNVRGAPGAPGSGGGGTAPDLTGYAKTADVVPLTTNANVGGVKTFTSSPLVPTPSSDMQASTKKYVDDSSAARVSASGASTISGVKTFSSSPIVPTPTTDMQTATKKYVDDSSSNAYLWLTGSDSVPPNTPSGTLIVRTP